MKTIRGADDKFISTCDGFGSVDENYYIVAMIMTKKIITNALAKLNLNYVSLLIKLAQPFNLNVE